jgi:hypothetical protein
MGRAAGGETLAPMHLTVSFKIFSGIKALRTLEEGATIRNPAHRPSPTRILKLQLVIACPIK